MLELVDEHLPGSLQTLVGGDVRKRDDDAVDNVLEGAIGSDAHEGTCGAALEVELPLDNTKRALHLLHIIAKLIVRQLGNDVGDGAAAVHVSEWKQCLHARCVMLDPQSIVEEHGCNLRAVQQVLQIAVEALHCLVLALQLAIDRLQLFVDRLQLLLGALELLVGGLQLFGDGLVLSVADFMSSM